MEPSFYMEQLLYIDEHVTKTAGSREQVWTALIEVLHRQVGANAKLFRLLGCNPAVGTPSFDGRLDQTLPGFRVVDVDAGRSLRLEGQHRFSRYRLTFMLDEATLRAQTHADFPGPFGQLYRAAVIGTGAHRIVTRRMLRQVARVSDRQDN